MAKKNTYLTTLLNGLTTIPVADIAAKQKPSNVVQLVQQPKPDIFAERCKNAGISPTGAIAEIMAAFSDCNGTDESRERNLDYKPTVAMDGPSLLRAFPLVMPEGYNDCTLESMVKVIKCFGETAKYFLGREGSVCLHVAVDLKERIWLSRISADEISLEPNGQFRLWWD